MQITYQVGDEVTIYNGHSRKILERSKVVAVTGTFYKLENGRRFAIKHGGEFGHGWDIWANYIQTTRELTEEERETDMAAMETRIEQAEREISEFMTAAENALCAAGRQVPGRLTTFKSIHTAGNAALTMYAKGRGLTMNQRETLLMAFAFGYGSRQNN